MAVTIDGSAGVTTNAGGSLNPSTTIDGINYSCRAWVNFNGTGTVAIRASGNVTSITDNGTGDYTVNFTNAMTDANYSPNLNMNINWGSGVPYGVLLFTKLSANSTPTTASFSFTTWTSSGGAQIDPPYVLASVFR